MDNNFETFELEKSRRIVGYIRHLIDDGWTIPSLDEAGSGVIEEIIEEVELRLVKSRKSELAKVYRAHKAHKGKWINKDVVELYAMRAIFYRASEKEQYKGKLRKLGKELQREYGVTELEAINILFGNNISDYLNKYYRMEHFIPEAVSEVEICKEVLEERAELAV